MQVSRRFVVSAVVPFATVWTVMWIFARPSAPKAISNVENLASYLMPSTAALAAMTGKEVWSGSPGDDSSWFNDFSVAGDHLVVVSDHKTIVIHAPSGRVTREIALGADGVVRGLRGSQVWLQAGRGRLRPVDIVKGEPTSDSVPLSVHPFTRSIHWTSDETLVANGAFDDGLVRRYALRAPQGQPERSLVQIAHGGHRLFRDLRPSIARPLNEASLAIRPSGDLLALAFRWSDRLVIYRGDALSVDRSIAGPVETKLDFAVVPRNGTPTFAFSPDSAYSYLALTADDDVIVALYAGRVRRTAPGRMNTAEQLHLFSWDGRLMGVVRVAPALQSIAVSGDVLYGLAWDYDRQPWIVSFDRNALLTTAKRSSGSS